MKLKPNDVRNCLESGMSVREIAEKYNCSTQAVYNLIRRGKADPTLPRGKGEMVTIDPATGVALSTASTQKELARIGDEKVSRFVQTQIETFMMGKGADIKNVPDLYNRFERYLQYCTDHGMVPGNMNAYMAIGVSRNTIYDWKNGVYGTPEQRQFAQDLDRFFAAIHEQGVLAGTINPITGIFWQKAYDGLSDQPKIEVTVNDPLGEKRSAEEIAKEYSDLPD